ncbi:MAG TPA: hypothetical protein VK611_15840 [Acidimicrobiales bacterium]|nr:hypothetical protein [Acidimicrobiales bacterium]
MTVSPAPPLPDVSLSLQLGSRSVDLATRAVVVAVVPTPRFGREAEVLAGVRAAALAGADVVEVPAESRLLGPAAASGELPIAAQATSPEAARAAWSAGARLLLVPAADVDAVESGQGVDDEWQVAVLVTTAQEGRDRVGPVPVALDTAAYDRVDAVSEESLALAVGVRLVRTTDVRRTRRVVAVMAHLLEARR